MPETSLMTVHAPPPPETVTPDDIKKFAGYINAGVQSWTAAGQLLVKMKSDDETIFEKITEMFPGISYDILRAFESIGHKHIYPYLLIDNCPGSKRLVSLPYEEQVRLYGARVDFVTGFKDGKPVVEKMRLQQLNSFQVERLFLGNRVKSVSEQAAEFEAIGRDQPKQVKQPPQNVPIQKRETETHANLTPSQTQVLILASGGKANKEIAFEMGISIKTVEKHRQEVMNKLNVHDISSLTRYAISKGLIKIESNCDIAQIYYLIKEIEKHCPCGARPESIHTHPHVASCPVAEIIQIINQSAPT